MDAVTHAVEGYVSMDWSPHQDARSMQALRMIRDNLERAVQTPEDDTARGNMLIAANLAITLALGSVHAMSHPCGAQFGVPHGVANAINLPHVVRFNAEGGDDIADRYRDLADLFGAESGGSGPEVGDALATHLSGLSERLGLPTRLSQVGVPESGIPALVEGAMGDGTTLLNPREPSESDYEELVPPGALASGQPSSARCARPSRAAWPWRCASAASAAAARPVGLHQHGLSHRVDPVHARRHQGQPGHDLRGGLHGQPGTGKRVPAERVGQVGHGERAAGGQVVGAGLAHAAHAGHEGAGHVVLVHELEARARVGDHRSQRGHRGEQAA